MIDKIAILIIILLFIASSILRKPEWRKRMFLLSVLLVGLYLSFSFLPASVFGTWNALSSLKNKKINRIIIKPSTPGWKVNLTSNPIYISDSKSIDTITAEFRKVHLNFPSHPIRIWETSMLFISVNKDTLTLRVNKTQNNGLVIESENEEFRNDRITKILEGIAEYRMPKE